MVTKSATARKPLVTAALLAVAAAHGTGLDTRGLNHWHPTCGDRAALRAQANGIRPYHLGGNLWVVASASRPGTAHQLRVWGQNGSTRVCCDCEGFHGHKHCWHSDLVARQIAESEAAAKAAPQPAPITRLEDLFRDDEPRAQLSREQW